MNWKKYITFALLLCPLLLFSQLYSIKGLVKDEGSHPLQNVAMVLQSSGNTYYTGKDGRFSIAGPVSTDTLSIYREGYQKEKRPVSAAVFNEIILKKAVVAKSTAPHHLSSLVQDTGKGTMQLLLAGNETYSSIVENSFIKAATNPTTGLSLNVDRASYSNIRRFLFTNSPVPPDAVRIEEMLNYFNLSYTEPKNNKTFDIITTLTACPWNKANQLLFAQVNSKKLQLQNIPRSHLVFLIDVSGSMDLPNRLPLLKSGFQALVRNLRPVDSVSIVVYGGTVGVALFPTSGAEKETIFRAIDSLQPGGATPGESGIKLAYSLAKAHFIPGGNNRVILATDGDFNVGLKREEELEEMISKHRTEGIYLTCLGVGMGNYKDSKIQTLAQKGNGNFAYLDNSSEVEKVLLKEFLQTLYTVADDAYLMARFNPDFVKEYRLIGFDNKIGAINDTAASLEGGEVGSAYSMLAAFEIVPAEEGQKQPASPVQFTLRYRAVGTEALGELNEKPQLSFTAYHQLPGPLKFASTVMMFGSLLRSSRFVKNISWNDVLDHARLSADPGVPSQVEFIQLVELAKKIHGKKRKKEE